MKVGQTGGQMSLGIGTLLIMGLIEISWVRKLINYLYCYWIEWSTIHNGNCVVPEDIHTPPPPSPENFCLVLRVPQEIPVKLHTLLLKCWL